MADLGGSISHLKHLVQTILVCYPHPKSQMYMGSSAHLTPVIKRLYEAINF
jgi:hypothetical protein